MADYMDSLNKEELKLFRKFNNQTERNNRHIDSYMLDGKEDNNPDLEDKMKYNKNKMIKDTLNQIKDMEHYFSDVEIEIETDKGDK